MLAARLRDWWNARSAFSQLDAAEGLPLLSFSSPESPVSSPEEVAARRMTDGSYNRHASASMRRRRHIPIPKSDPTVIMASRSAVRHEDLAVRVFTTVADCSGWEDMAGDGRAGSAAVLLARLGKSDVQLRSVLAELQLSAEEQDFVVRRLLGESDRRGPAAASSAPSCDECLRLSPLSSGGHAIAMLSTTADDVFKSSQVAVILDPSRDAAAIVSCGGFCGLQSFAPMLDGLMRRNGESAPQDRGECTNILILVLLASCLLQETAREVRSLCANVAGLEREVSVVAEKESALNLFRRVHGLRRSCGAAARMMLQKQRLFSAVAAFVESRESTAAGARNQIAQLQLAVARLLASLNQSRDILTGITTRTSAGVQLRNRAIGAQVDDAAVVMSQLNAWCLPGSIITNLLSMSIETPKGAWTSNFDFFFVVVTLIVLLLAIVVTWEAGEVKFEGELRAQEQKRVEALRKHFAALGVEPVEVSRNRHLVLSVQAPGGTTHIKALTASSLLAHLRTTAAERARSQSCPNLQEGRRRAAPAAGGSVPSSFNWLDVLRAGSDELLRVLSCFADRLDVELVVSIVSSILVDSVAGNAASLDSRLAGPQSCGGEGSFCVGLVCLDGSSRPCRVAVICVDPQWAITVRAANVPALQRLHDDFRQSPHHQQQHQQQHVKAEREHGASRLHKSSSFCVGAKAAELTSLRRRRKRQLSCAWLLASLQEGAVSTCGSLLTNLLHDAQTLEKNLFAEEGCGGIATGRDDVAMQRVVEIRRALNAQSKFLLAVEHQSRAVVMSADGDMGSTSTAVALRPALEQTLEAALGLRRRYAAASSSLQRVTTTITAFATAHDAVETAARNSTLLWFTELNAACLPALLVYKVFGMSIATPFASMGKGENLAPFWLIVWGTVILLSITVFMAMRERQKKSRKIRTARDSLRLARLQTVPD